MKFSTLLKNEFSGEYWEYENVLDPQGEDTTVYTKVSDITFSAMPAGKGNLFLLHPDQLQYNGQIRNLRDSSGNLVFVDRRTGQSLIAYIGVSEPHFTVFGELQMWRHDLSQGIE